MKAGVLLAALTTGSSGFCNITDVRQSANHGGRNYLHFSSTSAKDCQQRCCADSRCGAFTWTSYQPHDTGMCPQGGSCCWLKSAKPGAFVSKDNCTSGEVHQFSRLMSPRLTKVNLVAYDPTGNLRDPSAMIRDPKTGRWHFWVVWSGGAHGGWGGYLHHYSADAIEGSWTNHGRAMNHSADPEAFDYRGMFSPSALYDEQADAWYLFYSGIGSNTTGNHISAQLVASSRSPDGPWTRAGLVTYPTGTVDQGFNLTWNGRRTDSGRAMKLNGQRGYWTKGCRTKLNVSAAHTCSEGAYFPDEPRFWDPPYSEWSSNPIFKADGSSGYKDGEGYENCEFFKGPPEEVVDGQRLLHVLCKGHHTAAPHFVSDKAGLRWSFVEMLRTDPAKEPTPVYHGAVPGDEAEVSHFLARQEGDDECASPTKRYCIGLYKLDWVPQSGQLASLVV